MRTIVIQIGNSDNKLTQNHYAHFVESMREAIGRNVYRIHFAGGSDWDAPWQNACWVCEASDDQVAALRLEITGIRGRYEQDSVAIVVGNSEFI